MRAIKTKLRISSGSSLKSLRVFSSDARKLRDKTIKIIEARYKNGLSFLSYEALYHIIKLEPEYRLSRLNTNIAQNIIREVINNYKGYFKLLELKAKGKYLRPVSKPSLNKKPFGTIYINKSQLNINDKREFTLPSRPKQNLEKIIIKIPNHVDIETLRQIQIIPREGAKFFSVHYIYDEPKIEVEKTTNSGVLGIDLGLKSLMMCVDGNANVFEIPSDYIVEINREFRRKLSTIKKNKFIHKITHTTKRQINLQNRRANQIDNFLTKACLYIVEYCKYHNIKTIIVGHNENFQDSPDMGRNTNYDFTNIPLGKIFKILKWRGERYGIKIVEQEESYTSQASFFDNDDIPTYSKNKPKSYTFTGTRKGKTYVRKCGIILDSDVNGALNIIKKHAIQTESKKLSAIVDALIDRGSVNEPVDVPISYFV